MRRAVTNQNTMGYQERRRPWLHVFSLLLLLLLLPAFTQAFSSPAGKIESVCSSLMPGHGVDSKAFPSPYVISFGAASYSPGTPVAVTIKSCDGSPDFEGFLIQARRASNSADQEEFLGQFDPVAGTVRQCGGKGLSHSNSAYKSSVTFNWTPPATAQGHVVFRATFVQHKDILWADVVSDVLQDSSIAGAVDPATVMAPSLTCSTGGTAPTVPPTDPSTAPSNAASIQNLPECGVSKGCFSDCGGSKCSFLVSWEEQGDFGVYTLSSTAVSSSGSWVALGFSSDDEMEDDDVTGCAGNSNGDIVLFNGVNNQYARPTPYTDPEITLTSGQMKDGVISCNFRRKKTAKGKRVDITKSWTLFLARGRASSVSQGSEPSLSGHSFSDRFMSAEALSVSDIVGVGLEEEDETMVKLHGSLMVGAWIMFASIGIVVARYYKPVWKDNLCSQKVWFQIHRLCMIIVFCATVVGFILIFVEEKHWSELNEEKEYLDTHPYLGVTVTALTVLNPIMAFFRPHPGTANRPIFNWAHWFVGFAAHVLGVITIFFGVQLSVADVPDYVVYILFGYVGWQVLVEIVLEILQCWNKKKGKAEMYEMTNINEPDVASVQKDKQLIKVKRAILFVHIFVVSAISAVVIAFIAVGESELED